MDVRPVHPREWIVLTVGIVVAQLGASTLISHHEHGGANAHEQACHQGMS